MQVFLLRHAEAIDETLELRDPDRHLTPRGREQARRLGDRMRWHDCAPTHVWTSPLARAVQTAE
ncbi:MAG TPA: phosphoglycerate mutase family protein, partial [Kofleriaceae bacterium]|nr:phosphoglycerate mutase family protein [Kofleriaceae bacterium]